jgi:hypothetical protein
MIFIPEGNDLKATLETLDGYITRSTDIRAAHLWSGVKRELEFSKESIIRFLEAPLFVKVYETCGDYELVPTRCVTCARILVRKEGR